MRAALGTAGHMNDLAAGQRPRRLRDRGASARAAISPDAQIGAPAQATTRRRGSAGSTMKPSAPASARKLARAAGDKPTTSSARPGAVRRPAAPAWRAASISRCNVSASECPNGRPSPTATCRPTQAMHADRLGGGARRGQRHIDDEIGDRGLNASRSVAWITSRMRDRGACRGQRFRAGASTHSTARSGATAPSGVALAASPPSAT